MQNESVLPGTQQSIGPSETINVSQQERVISIIAAPVLAVVGVKRGGFTGFLLGLIAAELTYRGATGHSPLYRVLGINTAVATQHRYADISVPHEQGIHLKKSIYIARPKTELYSFWRNFSNLPRFMPALEVVRELTDIRSHWVARGPLGITRVTWDAEIVNEVPNEVIGWRSVEGSMVANAGSVRFETTPDNLGTMVHVEMEYVLPAGLVGKLIAAGFSAAPEQKVLESLECFKGLMETGEVPGKKKASLQPAKLDEQRRREVERRSDRVQMTSEDSFPASDPPASW